jgi:hypothetical protein
MASQEPQSWSSISHWSDSCRTSELERRQKWLKAAVNRALSVPHEFAEEHAVAVTLSMKAIIASAEHALRPQMACLLAMSLRRSANVLQEGTVAALVVSAMEIVLMRGNPMHHRALAGDFACRALAIHAVQAESLRAAGAAKMAAVFPRVMDDLGLQRKWAKRGMGQGKDAQEASYDDVAELRKSFVDVCAQFYRFGFLENLDFLLPAVSEPGYKARDFSLTRVVLATLGTTPAVTSADTLQLIRTRVHEAQAPQKQKEKEKFQSSTISRVIWLWDERTAGAFATVCCKSLGHGDDEAGVGSINNLLRSAPTSSFLEVAVSVSRTAPPVLAAIDCAALFDRLFSSLLSLNPIIVGTALDVARRTCDTITTFVGKQRGSTVPPAFAETNVWLASFPALLQRIISYHGDDGHIVVAAFSAWFDMLALRVATHTVDDAEVGIAFELAHTVLCHGPNMKPVFVNTLRAVARCQHLAIRRAFSRPLVHLLVDLMLASDTLEQELLHQFYLVIDAPAAGADGGGLTLQSIDEVSTRLESGDPRLSAVSSLYVLHRRAGSVGQDGLADFRGRLDEARLVAVSDSDRVMLAVAAGTA